MDFGIVTLHFFVSHQQSCIYKYEQYNVVQSLDINIGDSSILLP